MHDVRVRACNRAAALHGSGFAPMCSALIFRHRPYNSKAMTSWKAAFKSYGRFDSMVGVRMLQSCYLIVKGLFATPPRECPRSMPHPLKP